jgi:hypothetical protein
MKKTIFFTVCALIGVATAAQAQNTFAKGDKVANIGVGIGSYLGGAGYTTSVPPISASFEMGIVDKLFNDKSSLGVGGYFAYSANKYETSYASYTYGYKYSYIILGARGFLHYQLVNRLDTYAGIMLGYNIATSKYDGDAIAGYKTPTAQSAGGFAYSAFAGARFYFTDSFAAFAEVGYGIAILELGVSFKF